MKKLKILQISSNGELDLNSLSDLIDVGAVENVMIEELEDGCLSLTFFDKNGDQLKLKDQFCGAV